MELEGIFRGMTLSGAGLDAERRRIDVIAENIANANVVATPGGEPYRRREVVFETVLEGAMEPGSVPGTVRVAEVATDFTTPLSEVYDPKHPLADPETGIVRYSNVNMSYEMVDLLSASRSYEANLKAISTYREMVEQALRLLEG